jgi:diacylglycerol kinase family enzyme
VSARHGEADGQRLGSLEAIDSAQRRRVLVIINPYATTVTERRRDLVLSALAARYDVEAIDTRAAGHATEIAAGAAGGDFDTVVTFGGDGTVNEVANGLVGSPIPLTPLPGGSANVFCKLLGIPSELVDATAHLLALADCWQPRAVDLGLVAGRHYTFSAGVGLDASVVAIVDARPALKRRFGANFFLASAVWAFARHYIVRPPRLRVTVGGETFSGVTAIVQNGEHYTYFNNHPVDLAADAALDSGTLSGVVLERGSPLDVPGLLLRAVGRSRGVAGHHRVSAFITSEGASVVSADGRRLPLQLDGDYIGEVSEAHFSVVPGALRVLA